MFQRQILMLILIVGALTAAPDIVQGQDNIITGQSGNVVIRNHNQVHTVNPTTDKHFYHDTMELLNQKFKQRFADMLTKDKNSLRNTRSGISSQTLDITSNQGTETAKNDVQDSYQSENHSQTPQTSDSNEQRNDASKIRAQGLVKNSSQQILTTLLAMLLISMIAII